MLEAAVPWMIISAKHRPKLLMMIIRLIKIRIARVSKTVSPMLEKLLLPQRFLHFSKSLVAY